MNSVNLVGRITNELQLQYTQNGKNYLKFNLAVRRDKENSDFINCIAWNKTAELIIKHFQKGNQLAITGRIQTGSYDTENGKRYTTDIVVNQITFISENKATQGTLNNQGYNNTTQHQTYTQQTIEQNHNDNIDISEDDLPFSYAPTR